MIASLLNGLWEGALVAALAALATALLPQRHAATRYAVWFAALVALAALPLLSFWHASPAIAALPMQISHTAATPSVVTARAATAGGPWLPLIWGAGVCFGIVRLAFSYVRISRIRRRARFAPQFGPDVLLCDTLPFPIAAGFISPVVIVPSGLVSSLERDDLESILRHERAHIVRNDIAGNYVQRAIEACLFFNPWVYIIGLQLVKEREAACDDWAVHAGGEPGRYASCLAQLAQRTTHPSAPLLTPSAIGSRKMLVGRIARLLNGKAIELNVNYLVLGASATAFAALAVLLQTSSGVASVGNTVAATATLSPSCYADVKALNPAMPDIPKSAYRPNLSANALVTVAPDGHPVNAKIVKSSGSPAVDHATVEAAMASTYVPKKKACKAVTGEYLFNVDTGP